MNTKNKHFKNIIQWILAAALAFVLANILIIPYWYAPGWTSRDSGATPAIYHAGKTVINGHEGYGWAHVDERGYLNEDKPLADEVVLVMGCSHTKAIEVPMNKRYTSLLNKLKTLNLIHARNSGVKGTYIKILEPALQEWR